MKKLFTVLFLAPLLFLCIHSSAQDFDNYKFLQSTGKVPASFLKSSKQKSDEEIQRTFEEKKRTRYKRQKKEFILEANYVIDDLLLSGKVLFNDSIGQYANKIVDVLLKDDPKLRSEIEVYVVKSSVVNAFTTSRGTIFINLGLISKLRTEAELAYVLCHEIIHYKNRHSMTEFDVAEDIKRGNGSFRNTTYGDKLLAKSMFSKDLEKEADIQGLAIFRKSNYNLEATSGVFDVLQYAHIPLNDEAFDKSFLEFGNLKFPLAYQLATTNPAIANIKDDSLSTHPGTLARRDTIKAMLAGVSNAGRKNYLVDSLKFQRSREIARFEIAQYYLDNRRYEDALYHSYVLLQTHPNSRYLQKVMMKALYGLAKYSFDDKKRFEEIHQVYEDVEGKQQEVFYLFYKMNDPEMYTIALNYAWRLKKKYPGDDEISAIAEDEFETLVDFYFPKKDFFLATADSVTPKDSVVEMVSMKEKSKSKTISKTSKRNKWKSDDDWKDDVNKNDSVPKYLKHAFASLLSDDDFIKAYDRLAKGSKKRADEREKWNSDQEKTKRQELHAYRLRHGNPQGIDKIVIVNPFYYKVKVGFNVNFKDVASEEAQAEFSKEITDMAKESGINYELLDKKHLEENGAGAFNDNAILTSWINEFYEHGSDMDFINYKRPEIKALIAKYHTKYFCWTGIISEKHLNLLAVHKVFFSLIGFPVFPYLFYKAVQPNYYTYQYSLVVNLETGDVNYVQLHKFRMKDHRDMLKSSLYDLFTQLKTPIPGNENASK